MKKFLLFMVLLCYATVAAWSQNGCAAALALTPGVEQCGNSAGLAGDFPNAGGAPENPCDANYDDDEYWFSYTATANGEMLDLNLDSIDMTWAGLFVLDSCAGGTTSCVASATNNGSTAPLLVTTPGLVSGHTYYVVISNYGTPNNTSFCLNSVVIAPPACPDPTGLGTANVMATTADVNWTEIGTATAWKVEYGPDGFAPGAGTTVLATTTPTTSLTGLTQNTDYDVYVQSICGPGDSSMVVGPASFATPCAVLSAPYTTDFSTFVPACWDEADAGDPSTGPTSPGFGEWFADGFGNVGSTGAAAINLYNVGTSDWLLSPEIDITGGGFQVEFDVALTTFSGTTAGNLGSDDEVQALITDDAGATWDTLMVWNSASTISNTGDNIIISLAAYTGVVQIAFWGYEGIVDDTPDMNFFVDNFFVRTPPTCFEVTDLGTRNLTATTAELFWTASDPASNWKVEYDTAGFTLGAGTMVLATDTFLNLTGLLANTAYEFYIKEICGAGDSSLFVGPAAFTTIAAGPPQRCSEYITPNDGDTVEIYMPLSFTVPTDADSVYIIAGQDLAALDTFIFAQADTISLIYSILDLDSTYYIQLVPFNSAGATPGCPIISVVVKSPPPTVSGAMCSVGGLNALYTENFAATNTGGWTGDIGTVNETWRVTQSAATGSPGTGPSGPHDGTHYAYYEASTNTTPGTDTASIISPAFDLSAIADAVELEFFVHMFGQNMGNLRIEATADTAGSPVWSPVGLLEMAFNDSDVSAYFPVRYDLTSFAGGNVYVRFTAEKLDPADFSADMAIDKVSIRTCVGCASPSDGVASNMTEIGADLTWTENGTATMWYLEIDTAGFTPGTGSFTTTVSAPLPYTWAGGMQNTNYDFYVSAICGGSMVSDTSGPYSFTTNCGIQVAEYCQGFESGFPPTNTYLSGLTWDCWSATSTGSTGWAMDEDATGSGSTGPTGPNSGAWYIYLETSGGVAGDTDTLTSPVIDASSLTTPRLAFNYHMYGATIGRLSWEISDDMGASWTLLDTLVGQQQTASADPWIKVTQDISSYGNMVMIRFVGTRGTDFTGDISLDDVCVEETPGCEPPSAFTALNVTFTTADLDWTPGASETDWVVSYGPAPTTAGGGTNTATIADSLDLTGLSIGTAYNAYVRAVCGADSSVWVPVSFTTLTPPPANDTCGGAMPMMCGGSVIDSNFHATSYSGSFCVTSTGTFGLWYSFVGNGNEVTASTINPGTNFDTKINVYSGDCNALVCVGGNDDSGGSPQSEVIFIAATGTTYYIYVSGFSSNQGVWEFSLTCNPCFPHSNVTVSDETPTTAKVSWTAAAGATAFTVEYGPDGFVQGTGTVKTTGPNGGPITMNGLMPQTDYDVYVAETCGGMTDTLGPVSFTTECAAIVPYYLDSFNTFLPDCWNEATSGTIATGPTGVGSGDWQGDDFGNIAAGPNGKSAKINVFDTHSDWLLSPMFDLGAGGHTLTFDIAAAEWNSSTLPAVWAATDTLHLLMSEDGGATWASLMEWNQSNIPSLAGDSITIDLNANVSPTTQFAFYITNGGIDSPEDIDVFVDQFEITSPPPCAPFIFVSGSPTTATYRAADIISDATITSPNMIEFQAGTSAELNNGFEVQLGSEFHVYMVDCP